MRRLKQYIPGYEKCAGGAYAATRAHLADAIQRAEGLAARFTADTAPEPYTDVVNLVKLLTALAR